MITTGNCGFVVPSQDPAAFADALENAASDRDSLKRMSQQARILAERKFSRVTLGNQFVDWLDFV